MGKKGTPKAKKQKPVTLAESAVRSGLITKERARQLPDDEMMRREYGKDANPIAQANTSGSGARQYDTIRITDTPVLFLYQCGSVTQSQFEAAEKFRNHYEASGLDPMRASDWTKPYVDGGTGIYGPEFRDRELTNFNAAVKSLGPWTYAVVEAVVLRDMKPADVPVAKAMYDSQQKRTVAGITVLRMGLSELAVHFGLPKDWSDGIYEKQC